MIYPNRVGVSLEHTQGFSTGSESLLHSTQSSVNSSSINKRLIINAHISDRNLAILNVLSKSIGILVSKN